MKKGISRRNLLIQAGGASLALPFLPSLLPKAFAAGGKPPKRFIAVSHEYGHHLPHFFPNVTATNKFNDHTYYMRLSDIPGPMSVVLNEKFDPYRSKMNIYQGLDSIGGGGHNRTVPLQGGSFADAVSDSETSGPKYGRSIDVLMAKSASVYSSTARFDAIRIGNDRLGVSWDRDANNNPIAANNLVGDQTVFNAVFGGFTADPAAQAASQRQTLIVDKIFERYLALRNNPRMSAADKARFEQHVASVTDLQKRLLAQGACSVPNFTPYNESKPREVLWRNNIDALVSAMACDLTRVGVLFVLDYKFGTDPQIYSESHGNSHDREGNPVSQADAARFSAFKSDQILYLLQRLSNIIEADGSTMLDNTVILWTAELSNGNYHVSSCLPAVTFGNAGGALNTGYLMDFRLKPVRYIAGRSDFLAPLGQAYNRLLVTLMRAMGMQPAEYMSEGDGGGYGEFKTKIEYLTNEYTQFISQRNDPLPIVFG